MPGSEREQILNGKLSRLRSNILKSSIVIILLLGLSCQELEDSRVSTNWVPPSFPNEPPEFLPCSCDSATFCLTDSDVMIVHMIYAQNKEMQRK